MAFHNTHGSGQDYFTCSAPWQHKVSQFYNTKYTMLVINAHQPYPTAYQVGALEMLVMCCCLTKVPLDLPTLSSWNDPIRGGEPHLSGVQQGQQALGLQLLGIRRIPSDQYGTIEGPCPLYIDDDGDIRLGQD